MKQLAVLLLVAVSFLYISNAAEPAPAPAPAQAPAPTAAEARTARVQSLQKQLAVLEKRKAELERQLDVLTSVAIYKSQSERPSKWSKPAPPPAPMTPLERAKRKMEIAQSPSKKIHLELEAVEKRIAQVKIPLVTLTGQPVADMPWKPKRKQ